MGEPILGTTAPVSRSASSAPTRSAASDTARRRRDAKPNRKPAKLSPPAERPVLTRAHRAVEATKRLERTLASSQVGSRARPAGTSCTGAVSTVAASSIVELRATLPRRRGQRAPSPSTESSACQRRRLRRRTTRGRPLPPRRLGSERSTTTAPPAPRSRACGRRRGSSRQRAGACRPMSRCRPRSPRSRPRRLIGSPVR